MPLKHRLRASRRWLIIAGVVVVVVGAGIGVWRLTRPQPAPPYRAVAVTTATLRQTVSSSGTIEPAQQDNLNFAVSGQVTAVNVAVGQQVSSGQALATVNSASLSASVADAQATLSSDQAKLSGDQTANASSAQINADQAAVTAAQNQVTDAQKALSEATLTAPINGTVAAVNLTAGQQVAGGSSSTGASTSSGSGSGGSSSGGGQGGAGGGAAGGAGGGGTGGAGGGGTSGGQSGGGSSSSSNGSNAQIVVVSNGSYIINASVDDTEVGQIQTGDQAVITPNGSSTPAYGLVTSVGMLATSSSGVPTYPVTISVTGSPGGLFAGAGASVEIVVKQLTDVPVVPSAAIHFTNGTTSVLLVSNGQEVTRSITIGMVSGGQTQIISGLSVGDQVLVPNTARGGTGTAGRAGGGAGAGGGGAGGAGRGIGGGGFGGFGGGGGGGGGGRGGGG